MRNIRKKYNQEIYNNNYYNNNIIYYKNDYNNNNNNDDNYLDVKELKKNRYKRKI